MTTPREHLRAFLLALFVAAIVFLLLFGPLWLLTASARAHDWYDPICCSDRDCAPIPFSSVRVTAQGYAITLSPDQHPMLANEMTPHEWLIPFGSPKVRDSKDDAYHACIVPGSRRLLCFYALPMGV